MLSLTVNFFSLPNLHKGLHADQRSDCRCLSFALGQGKCLGPAEPSGLQLPLRSEPDCLPVHPLTVRCSRPGTPKIPSQLPVTGIHPMQLRGRSWQERRSAVSSHAQYFQQSNIFFFFVALLCFRKTLFSLTVFSC